MKNLCLLLTVLLVPALASAQAPAAAPAPAAAAPVAAPEAPKPAPEVKNFEFLVGDWIHEETWTAAAMGTAGRVKGVSKGQWVLGEHVLQLMYKANTSMLGGIEARGFVRFDAEKKVYVFDWITNRGTSIHMEGTLEGKALVLLGERTLAGQARKEKLTLAPQDDGSIVQKIELVAVDGTLTSAVEGKITSKPKVAEAPKQ